MSSASNHITDSRLLTFAGRNDAMNFLKELRKNPDALRDTTDMRIGLSIPPADYQILKVQYPVLVNGSTAEKKKFWQDFYNSSDSDCYKVRK